MGESGAVRIMDVVDLAGFRLPPCADPRFDHRSCDYWEDDVRGSKSARREWWQGPAATPDPAPARSSLADNPFAPPRRDLDDNPFAPTRSVAPFDPFADDPDDADVATDNPFAPQRLA